MGFWQNEKIERQAAEIERLRAALEPFADMHDKWWAGGVMFLPLPDEHTVLVEFVHLRKAKEALK